VTAFRSFFRALASRSDGTALIETAIVAPVLIMMAIGTFEASAMVARQSELQSSAEQATEIALAMVPDTNAELGQVREKLMTSSGLGEARVSLQFKYRCASAAMVTAKPACTDDSLNTYIAMELSDEYQPIWTHWGFAKSFEYNVRRTVQIS
jgi:Flp pilus assembly protein TadG